MYLCIFPRNNEAMKPDDHLFPTAGVKMVHTIIVRF